MRKLYENVKNRLTIKILQAKQVLAGNEGEGFIDTAIKILMAVVIGALLLAGLYAMFGDIVLPTLNRRITEMFEYTG